MSLIPTYPTYPVSPTAGSLQLNLVPRRAGGGERVGLTHWCLPVFPPTPPASTSHISAQPMGNSSPTLELPSQPHLPATHCLPDMTFTVLPLTFVPTCPPAFPTPLCLTQY